MLFFGVNGGQEMDKIPRITLYLSTFIFTSLLLLGIVWLSGFRNVSALELQAENLYYVSPFGDDTKSGFSPNEAWKTITKVNSMTFTPGDQILFERGSVWNETLIIASSGTQENPITFGAYGNGEKPTIDGQNTLSQCVASEDQGDFITIDGLRIINCGDPGLAPSGPEFEEWHGCIVSSENDGWTIRNSDFENCGQRAIFARGDPTGPEAAKDWLIEDNFIGTVSLTGSRGSDQVAILLRGLDQPIVRRNVISPVNTSAISCNTGGQMKTGAECSYPDFYDNEVTDAAGCNISAMWTDYAKMHHNYIHDSRGAGICASYDSDYAEIFYNIIHDLEDYQGTHYNGIDINLDSDDGMIYNNVVINVAYVNITVEDMSWDDQSRSSDGWIIRNNILDARGNSPAEVPIAIYPECKGIVISNNIYIPNENFWGGGYVGRWHGEYMKFEYNEWQDASGDEDSIVVNPILEQIFMDDANHDYHLAPSSPAIDNGYYIIQTLDFEGNLVPQGNAPEIGAYELPSTNFESEDINLDGGVDSIDLQLCINVSLGIEKTPEIVQRSDMNGDDEVDQDDVQLIVLRIMGFTQ
jgi:hypothetical protein